MATVEKSVVAARVAAARARAGLTREALAVASGLSWSAITQIETGRRANPRADTVAALARGLGVTTDYLLGTSRPDAVPLDHRTLIYASTEDFVHSARAFLEPALEIGDATLVVSHPPHIEAIREALGDGADPIQFADCSSWYTSPRDALGRYRGFLNRALDAGTTWVRIIGEPSWSGRSAEELALWARYESLLNLVFAHCPLSLACPYDESAQADPILDQARASHRFCLRHGTTTHTADYLSAAEACL